MNGYYSIGLGQGEQPWFMQMTNGNSAEQAGIVAPYQWTSLGIIQDPILPSADYQGRKWLGESTYSGLGGAGSFTCMLACAAVSAAVAAGVTYYLKRR